jgi:single-strand DNA-binding protein
MARSVNKIFLMGNVGRDPDIQHTQNGTKVAHLSLATNRRLPAGADDTKERTDWHRLTCWNRLAQFVEEHITTGDRLYIEGRLEYDSYERDGVTIPTAEITVHELVMLTPRAVTAGVGAEDE